MTADCYVTINRMNFAKQHMKRKIYMIKTKSPAMWKKFLTHKNAVSLENLKFADFDVSYKRFTSRQSS